MQDYFEHFFPCVERSVGEFMGIIHLTNPRLYPLWPSLLSVRSLLFVPVSLSDYSWLWVSILQVLLPLLDTTSWFLTILLTGLEIVSLARERESETNSVHMQD